MIPSNVDIAVITATPSTDQTKAEIKIESSLGQTLDVITQNYLIVFFIYIHTYMFIYSSSLMINTLMQLMDVHGLY